MSGLAVVTLLLATVMVGADASVTIRGEGEVNVGCNVNPLMGLTTLSVFVRHDCVGRNGGNLGDTFYLQGNADGQKACQGPSTWYSFVPPLESGNETAESNATVYTLPELVPRNIWYKTDAKLQADCVVYTIFNLYEDSGCSAPYNLVVSGPSIFGLTGYEDPSVCFNQSNSPYSGNWRPEFGSYTISAAPNLAASTTIITLLSIAAAVLTIRQTK